MMKRLFQHTYKPLRAGIMVCFALTTKAFAAGGDNPIDKVAAGLKDATPSSQNLLLTILGIGFFVGIGLGVFKQSWSFLLSVVIALMLAGMWPIFEGWLKGFAQ